MTDENQAVSFFHAAYRTFEQSAQSLEPVTRSYSIGGYTVRLRFAGPALVPALTPALEHLATNESAPASLTVCLWDSVSTRSSMPSPPWALDDYLARGDVREYNDERILTACHKGSAALSLLDRKANLGLWWIRDAADVPFYETGSPLLTILHWWMNGAGRQVVHAAAVGTSEAAVLLAGRGGSGKSSTALSCMDSDLLYIGDDYCLLSPAPVPYVYSLFSSGKLDGPQIQKFPNLSGAITNPDRLATEKALLLLHQCFPRKVATGLPVRAILIPRITGGEETSLMPASSMTALTALAPSTLFQLSNANQSALRAIAGFSRQLPCYHLNLGTDLRRIPTVLLDFLEA